MIQTRDSGALAFRTGGAANTPGTSATERMRIDSLGNVGIGTQSPQRSLSIGNDGALAFQSPDNTVEEKGAITWRIEDNSEGARISTGRTAIANAPHSMAFWVRSTAGAVTERFTINPDGLLTGSGTSLGAWTAYTPTLGGTGWALGDGTANFAYAQIGKVVHARGQLQFGSTSTFGTGQLTVGLPVSANSSSYHRPVVSVLCYDVSAGSYFAGTGFVSGNAIYLSALNSSSGQLVNLVNTSPFTWASVDFIRISVTYEAA